MNVNVPVPEKRNGVASWNGGDTEEMHDAVHELAVSLLTWTNRQWLGARGLALDVDALWAELARLTD